MQCMAELYGLYHTSSPGPSVVNVPLVPETVTLILLSTRAGFHQQVVESLVIEVFPRQGLITHYNSL